MQQRFLLLCSLVLTACAPLVPMETEETSPFPPETQAEEIGEGEQAAQAEQKSAEITIVERLLPSGFIEIGDREAPLVLLMFTEHHCRYCKDFYRDHFPKLHRDFIEQGKLKLQIGILPLKKYIDSEAAAKGLLCAATQSKAMPMHELLFELGARDRDVLQTHAQNLELDTELFTQCLDSPDTQKTIDRQKSIARSLDVTLVPTFFLNGEKSVGLPYYADLRGMIEAQLTE